MISLALPYYGLLLINSIHVVHLATHFSGYHLVCLVWPSQGIVVVRVNPISTPQKDAEQKREEGGYNSLGQSNIDH